MPMKKVVKLKANPKPAKAVAVAREVLSLLRKKKLTPTVGVYVGVDIEGSIYSGSVYSGKKYDFQKLLMGKEEGVVLRSCAVCAVGGLIAGYASKWDAIMVGNRWDDNPTLDGRNRHLHRIFSMQQLKAIEATFEADFAAYDEVKMWGGHANQSIIRRYEDDREGRMKAIMRNIIRNKGQFRL